MTNGLILYYLFAAIFLDIFYLAHRYIFTKYSFLKWDRYYFLSILILAFILPLVPIPSFLEINIDQLITQRALSRIDFSQGIITIKTNTSGQNLAHLFSYLSLAYFVGFTTKFLFFTRNVLKIQKKITKAEAKIIQGIKLYKCKSQEIAFTFFHNIYISEDFLKLPKESQIKILHHEELHSQQLHSFDILVFQIISIILWFNPLNRTILKTIKAIHEFLADEAVIRSENPKDYMHLLLKINSNQKAMNLSSAFAGINLKKRILIMKRYSNEQIQKRLFLGFIPVILLLIFSLTLFSPFLKANPIIRFNKFINPFGNKYQILAPYFKLKNTKQNFKISHSCISVSMSDYAPLLSVANGKIIRSEKSDNWGVTELRIILEHKPYLFEYQGLAKSLVHKNQLVKKGDTIGFAGKQALYPRIDFTILKNGKKIAPRKIIKF